jgi:poly(A) polymerase
MPAVPQLWQENASAEALAKLALINTDERIKIGKPINPAFLLAVLYWPIMCNKQHELEQTGQSKGLAFDTACLFAISLALQDLGIPKRYTNNMREIRYLQRRFIGPRSKRLLQVLDLPRFRAGYDFLLLRAQIDKNLQPLAEWWTTFYEATDEVVRIALIKLKPAVVD